jgi:hypothetical protein
MERTNPVMPHVNRQIFQIRRRDRDSVPGRGACGRLVAGRGFRASYGVFSAASSGLRVIRPKVIPCLKPPSDEISTLDHGVTLSHTIMCAV